MPILTEEESIYREDISDLFMEDRGRLINHIPSCPICGSTKCFVLNEIQKENAKRTYKP